LDVQGTDEFKKQMVIITIKYGVDIKFKDTEMERMRSISQEKVPNQSKDKKIVNVDLEKGMGR